MNDFQDVIIDAIESNLNELEGVTTAYESGNAVNIGNVVLLDKLTLDVLGRIRLNFQSTYWSYELLYGVNDNQPRTTVGNGRITNSQALDAITEWATVD